MTIAFIVTSADWTYVGIAAVVVGVNVWMRHVNHAGRLEDAAKAGNVRWIHVHKEYRHHYSIYTSFGMYRIEKNSGRGWYGDDPGKWLLTQEDGRDLPLLGGYNTKMECFNGLRRHFQTIPD